MSNLTIIQSLSQSVPQALAMLAGMELGVFTPLKDGPLTTEALASVLGVEAARLRPVLAVLAAAGLLSADDEGRFANSTEADALLVRGRPGYMGGVYELWADMWRAELLTARSVRSGKAQAAHNFAAMSPEELHAFVRGSHSGAVSAGREILRVAQNDSPAWRTLLDVGGGSGGLAITLAAALPALNATVVELPQVARITQYFVDEARAGDRVSVAAADVVREALPVRGDVAVCNRFIQVLAPDLAARAIQHVADALEPDGLLYIIGHVLEDSRLGPPPAVAYGLLALNMYDGGQAFTESEHREWLSAAGLTDISRVMLGNGYSLMFGRKGK